jgi:hypothetical protein
MRAVEQNQPELKKPLDKLAESTSDVIQYKKFGTLGVTLVMLDPVLRQLMPQDRRGRIPREPLADFEREINEELDHAHYSNYDVPLSDAGFYPLELYGKDKRYLGIRLDKRDYRLIGDRAMVEEYICDNYDVSRRFLARNLVKMSPHITIGAVRYENMEYEDRQDLHRNPSDFILTRANRQMRADAREYGLPEPEPIEFAETVTLNGLKIFCQQR